MDTQLPNIYSYSDFRPYLADYQTVRVEKEKTFTKSYICKALGLPNTRGFFSSVLEGRKISPMYVERFVHLLKLRGDEAKYFRILVKLNQAEDNEERNQQFDQMLQLKKTSAKRVDIDQYRYYSKWYYSAVRALMAVGDYRDDFEQVAKDIRPPIKPSHAKDAINTLKRLKLIVIDRDGYYRPADKAITSGNFAEDEAIKLYQLQCLELAAAALRRTKSEDSPQDFVTNNLSVSKQAYSTIRDRLNRFREEICAIASHDEYPSECVYQINIALFSIGKGVKNEKRG